MRFAGGVAALTVAGMSTSAVAQTADQAFECNLSRPGAMEAASSLTVTDQRTTPESFLGGELSTIEFAPDIKVFGQEPASLSLKIVAPKKADKNRIVSIVFEAAFHHSEAMDNALLGAAWWNDDCSSKDFCLREGSIVEGMSLEYRRNPKAQLVIACRYLVDEGDL